jgi:hypothetical protein
MKRLIFILALTFLTSCEKEEIEIQTVGISLSLAYMPFQKSNTRPVTAKLTTDKGIYQFNLIPTNGGEHSDTVRVQKGIHIVHDLSLYDKEAELTHFANRGASNSVPSWVDAHEYNFTEGSVFFMAVTNKNFN